MYLRYYLNENGDRHYTLATIDPYGKPTLSAHPEKALYPLLSCKGCGKKLMNPGESHQARFSPEDKYSRQRIIIKKRFGLLLTQQPEPIL